MPNKLIEKIRDYLKSIGLYKLKDNEGRVWTMPLHTVTPMNE